MPTVGEMIRDYALASNIISRHGTDDDAVLDGSELGRLHRFCADPSAKDTILHDDDMVDEADAEPGTHAQQKGSLVGFCIAKHGTSKPALQEAEIERLRDWFETGAADDAMGRS